MTFHAEVDRAGATAILRMRGQLDAGADTVLLAAHAEAVADAPPALLLDFADVEYINSSGIALLVLVLSDAQRAGRRVRASGLTAHYRHIFEITRLTDYVQLDGDGTVRQEGREAAQG